MSAAIEITDFGANKGRGLVVHHKVSLGEVLFSENPLVSCQFSWNRLYGYLACHHCMRPLESTQTNVQRLSQNSSIILPHPTACPTSHTLDSITKCSECNVAYCSPSCCTLAQESYHAVLCLKRDVQNPLHPLNQLDEAWRSVHYPPEMSSIMLLARMVAMVKQSQNKTAIIEQFSNFCQSTTNESECLSHKLLGDKFVDQIERIRLLFTAALYEDSLSSWFTSEGFRSLLSLIGRNSQGIATSPLSIWVENCKAIEMSSTDRESLELFTDELYNAFDDTVGQFLDNEGVGLYSKQSLINHSCSPNCEIRFDGLSASLSVVAKQDIYPGEEVTISYLTECDGCRSRHSRQKHLQENYLFTCACSKCKNEADQASVTSDDEEEDMDDQ